MMSLGLLSDSLSCYSSYCPLCLNLTGKRQKVKEPYEDEFIRVLEIHKSGVTIRESDLFRLMRKWVLLTYAMLMDTARI